MAPIEVHRVAHGTPSVQEMRDIRTNMTAWASKHITPAKLAHDTLVAMGYRVEMVDGVIYRLEPGDGPANHENEPLAGVAPCTAWTTHFWVTLVTDARARFSGDSVRQ